MSINKEFQVRHGLSVNNTVLTANVLTNRVGVNTSNAQYTLDVNGSVNIANPTLLVAGINVLSSFSSSNSYAVQIGAASNAWANSVGVAGNNYTNSVGLAGNNYTNAVGVAGNNYSIEVGAASNTWANSIGVSTNSYSIQIGSASNTWANNVGTAGNNYTNAVGLASNNYTNFVGTAGNNYSIQIGAASNTWANSIGVAGNNYTNAVGLAGNNYTIQIGAASNTWANSVGVAGNNYTNAVGLAGNNYANFVGDSANSYSLSLATSGNSYSIQVGAASNNWSNAIGTAGNNYTDAVGVAGNNYTNAVGFAGNNYTVQVGAASNTWSNTVGTAGNNYTDSVGLAANNYANTTYFQKTGGTISGAVSVAGNFTVTGNLNVTGNTSFISVQNYRVDDPLIYIAGNNYISDVVDIGFIANYVNTTGSNVHTGLYREHENKEWYLFQGYDQEPANNHIGPLSNNMTLAVLNADLRTGNLNLGGINAIPWIASAFDKANSANVLAYNTGIGANTYSVSVGEASNNYAIQVGAASNTWSNSKLSNVVAGGPITISWSTTGGYTNATINVALSGVTAATYGSDIYVPVITIDSYGRIVSASNVAVSGGGGGSMDYPYANQIGAASNSWANTLSTIDRAIANAAANSANAYSESIGLAGNNYTIQVGAASNAWSNTLSTSDRAIANDAANSANVYTVTVGAASNTWANGLSTTDRAIANTAANSANAYTITVGQASNNYTDTVGVAGNNYTVQVGAASNTWANTLSTIDRAIANAAANSANAYAATVGLASNNYTNAVGVAGNNYTNVVGVAGNNYTDQVGAASNTWANTKVASITGTSGQIFVQGTTTPTLNLVSTGVSANDYGGATQIPVFKVDALGRLTYAANVPFTSSSSVDTSDSAPISPTDGMLWWNSSLGKLFIYYDDGNSLQWVDAAPSAVYLSDPLVTVAFDVANNAYTKANSANVLAYNTGIGANSYANTIASQAGVIANAAFNKANTSGPRSEWIIKNTNYTANVGDKIYCNTLAGFITITLPASPGIGNNVFVASGYNASNANVTIARNGSTIMGLSEDLVITETNISVDFVYDGSSWRIA